MEQASNTFNKGLQLDTHPMVQGNDSLTDCLNGTLVTMNGNEVVLQNDMGNRRVDNAFLPAGYEPVGIKEYGGIIYIAAYNPVTNRSQIGSFPSPERRIGLLDGSDLGGNIGPEQFTASNVGDLNNLLCLDTDTIQIPLTGKNSLHAGDKFVIYHTGENTWISKDYLSNYDNIYRGTNEEKIYSPKNKIYTAQIGILNSQNNFVDITRNLCRWDINNSEYIDTSNKPDLYKFNVGYFIKRGLYNFEVPDETISDSQLQLERALNKATVNTYAYKLVGPMYMQLKVNHIQNFDFNIWGAYDKNNKILTLTIEGTATYNCPDSLINGEGGANDTYKTFELLENFEGNKEDNFIMFDLFQANDESNSLEYIEQLTDQESNKFYSLKKGVFTYDEVSNLYTARITKEYIIKEFDEDIFNYVIGVRSPFDKNGERTYLAGLSVKGQINISLLGSGDTKARRWQFYYNDDGTITLRCNFDFYPKPDETLTNLTAYLTNVENPSDKRQIVLYNVISTGSQSKTLTISGLTPKALYKVELKYIINGETERNYDHDEFILTTKLFNDCFSSGSSQILDYGWPGGIKCDDINKNTTIEDNTSQEIKTFKEKLRIQPYITISVNNSGVDIKEEQSGSFVKKGQSGDIIEVDYTQYINPVFTIQDSYFRIKDLYPNYVKPIDSVQMKISNYRTNIDLIKGDIKSQFKNPTSDDIDGRINNHIKETRNNQTNDSINLKLEWKDFYKSDSIQYNDTIYNVFDSVENYINEHFDYNKTEITQISCPTVVQILGRMKSGHKDLHLVVCGRLKKLTNNNKLDFYNVRLTIHEYPQDNINWENQELENFESGIEYLYGEATDNRTPIYILEKEKIMSALKRNSQYIYNQKEPIFLYAFEDSTSSHYGREFRKDTDINTPHKIKTIDLENKSLAARVWWRTSNYDYILINSILKLEGCIFDSNNSVQNINENLIKNYFKNIFKTSNEQNLNNIMFCRYKELNLQGYICPAPQNSQILENSYICSIPYEIWITFSPLNSSILNLVNISNYGILNFYSEGNTITEHKEILPKRAIKSNNKYTDLIINGAIDNYRTSNIDLEGNYYPKINVIYNRQREEIECNYVNMRIDNINSNEYQLVYKASNIENNNPEYTYDYFDDDDSSHDTRTFSSYQNIPKF